MNVRQNLSVLFFLKKSKKTKEGKIPIYTRITVDGLMAELSLGYKIFLDDWNPKFKLAKSTNPNWKQINKKITQSKTDIERHFDLCQAKNGLVTAEMVKRSYSTPLSGSKARSEKLENLALSESLDDLVPKYLAYSDKSIKALEKPDGPSVEKRKLLDLEKESVNLMILKVVKKANSIIDSKEWQKTFILSVDEYLLNFLQLAFAGHRSPNSLEKMIGRKRRYRDFLQYSYKLDDIPLHLMEYSFIEELFKYLLVNHDTCENTAMKYAQWVKEITDRVVSKGWLPANIFSIFNCSYQDPQHDWLSMQELTVLKAFQFEKEKLNIIRDIFLFSSFTGFSYQEIYSLKPADILNGPNGKKWICKNRQKTGGNESLPLLPLPLNLLEKYKNHPICLKRGRLLPVPTNQEYNRSLKIIAQKTGLSIILRTHKTRFFFANEVTFNNGVPLKTVSKMLGHKSIKTTEIYVRANKQNITDSMDMVENKLFDKVGILKNQTSPDANQSKSNFDECVKNSICSGKIIKMIPH